MTTILAAIILLTLIQAAALAALLIRPRPVQYGSLEAAVDAMARVAAGLHEDIDSLRTEVRNLAALPPTTAIPHLTNEIRLLRIGFVVQTIAILAILVGSLLTGPARAALTPTAHAAPRWVSSPPGPTLRDPVTWWADGLAAAPAVMVEGGQGGVSSVEDDGAGGLRVVLWAQGNWRRVTADGVVIAERRRVALPLVR